MATRTSLGSFGSIATSTAPVVSFGGAKASVHVLPPSVVWYSPRWPPGLYRSPEAAAKTCLGFVGSTAIRPNALVFRRPVFTQLLPPSVDRYTPSPPYVTLPPPGFASPVPAQSVPSDPCASAPIAWG